MLVVEVATVLFLVVVLAIFAVTAHRARRPPRAASGAGHRPAAALGVIAAVAGALAIVGSGHPVAGAAEAPVGLGTATSVAVLGGSTVTNTGPSVISGDVDLSPGTSVTGFPPGIVNAGTIHATDAVATQAQADTTTAYNDAAGRSMTGAIAADLGGQTLVGGVYTGPTLGLTGTLTLNAEGDPNAVFIFQAGSTLITGSASSVALIGGAQACNVFWQVGSSATLGTNSVFMGTVIALTSITATTGASIEGRLLARNGAVTLDTNTITRPICAGLGTTTTTTPGSSTTTPGGTTTTADVAGASTTSSTSSGGGNPSTTGGGSNTTGPNTTNGRTTNPGLPATGLDAGFASVLGLLAIALGALLLVGGRRAAVREAQSDR